MDDKLNYQVSEMEDKLKRLTAELDILNLQVIAVEKNILILKGEATVVEQAVATMTKNSGWLYKVITAGFVTAIIGFVVAGGLKP